MSDFKWTDKSAVKWFVIYPQGHEGPYSLDYLEKKIKETTFSYQTKVWSEGLNAEMTLEAVLTLAKPIEKKIKITPDISTELPPPLPPLPEVQEIIPASSMKAAPVEIEEDEELETRVNANRIKKAEEKPIEAPRSSRPIIQINEDLESFEEDDSDSTIQDELSSNLEMPEFYESENRAVKLPSKKWKLPAIILSLFILSSVGFFYYLQNQERIIKITRPQGMSLKTADRIDEYLEFKGWKEPLFFKEFISEDYSNLWLASSSFQDCKVSAHFKSQKEKILSLNDEEVEFEGIGRLSNHLTEFSKFNFIAGKKIVPGMYDMTISAKDCQWDGIIPKVMNVGKNPESEYTAKMSVILYAKGADEFKDLLDRVVRKKLEKAVADQNQLELFWQGVQEKLQTLLAITLQIEQHFLDFIAKDARQFHVNVLGMVDVYTKKFGPFLTNFVVANQENFKELSKSDLRGVSTRKNYELQISESAREIGFTSMKLIEDFQKLKNPRRVQLNAFAQRAKKKFADIKNELNQKIIQVSDDRSLSPVEDEVPQNPSQE